MKVSLRRKYSYDNVELHPEEQHWDPEFVFDMSQKEVLDALRIQVEYEELQQKLQPMFKEAEAAIAVRREAEKAAEEAEEQEDTVPLT